MIINKKVAFFFLICNIVLVAAHFFLHFYLSESILGVNALQPGTNVSFGFVFAVVEIIFRLAISLGIFWVLKIFKEKSWLKVTFLAFFGWQILIVFSFGITNQQLLSFSSVIFYITISLLILLLIGFSLMQSRTVRPYLIWFAALTLLELVLPLLGGFLYDNFVGSQWLLINQRFMSKLPPLATLILFIVVFNISRRNSNVKEVTSAT